MKPSNDSEAMRLILSGLRTHGILATELNDGEDVTDIDNDEHALALLNNLDEAIVYFRYPDAIADKHSLPGSNIYFVMGNDPEEVVCDHGLSLSEYLDPIIDPWWD